MKDTSTRKALILKLVSGWLSAAQGFGDENMASYLAAVDGCSIDALSRSVTQFLTGKVAGRDNAFVPTSAELASNAGLWDYALGMVTADRKLDRLVAYPMGKLPPPPLEALGPLEVDMGDGRGRIDLRGKTLAEKEAIMAGGPVDAGERIGAPALHIKRMG